MTGAAEICQSIDRVIRMVKAGADSGPLVALMETLTVAPATGPLDALALAAVARKLLSSAVLGDSNPETINYAFHLICRTVETLEAETGISGDGFTGEVETIN